MPPFYRWNPVALRYIDSRGRFVSRDEVRSAIDRALDQTEKRIRRITNDLRSGRMTLAKWELAMQQQIKNVHLYNAAAARGGFAQLTKADLGRVGQIVRRQYEYLDGFAAKLARGTTALDGRMVVRASMYGQAGRGTYHKVDRSVHRDRGFREERSLLETGGRSCDECILEDARGWVPIGDVIPIGARTCLSRCRCGIEFR